MCNRSFTLAARQAFDRGSVCYQAATVSPTLQALCPYDDALFCSAVVHELAAHNRTMKMGAREEPVSHFLEREIAERVRNHSSRSRLGSMILDSRGFTEPCALASGLSDARSGPFSGEGCRRVCGRPAALSSGHQKSAGPRTNRVAPRYKLKSICRTSACFRAVTVTTSRNSKLLRIICESM